LESLRITFLSQPIDGMASASLLGHVKTEFTRGVGLDQALAGYYAPLDMLWGSRAGSLGETAALLLLIGGLFLIARRIITWHAPVAMLLGVALPALLFNAIDGNHYAGPMYHLLEWRLDAGGVLHRHRSGDIAQYHYGQFIFGLGCGLMTGSSAPGAATRRGLRSR